MIEDEPFLRAIPANPDDRVSRLVYTDWLDDREFAFIGYRETEVRRLSILDLEPLPSLSLKEAARRDPMPETPWR